MFLKRFKPSYWIFFKKLLFDPKSRRKRCEKCRYKAPLKNSKEYSQREDKGGPLKVHLVQHTSYWGGWGAPDLCWLIYYSIPNIGQTSRWTSACVQPTFNLCLACSHTSKLSVLLLAFAEGTPKATYILPTYHKLFPTHFGYQKTSFDHVKSIEFIP